MDITKKAIGANQASIQLSAISTYSKNRALKAVRDQMQKKTSDIVLANQADLEKAEKEKLPGPLLKRLKFDESKIEEACEGLGSLSKLPDPVGRTLTATKLDGGLELYKVTCPIGVIGVVFESRPDALVQISSLCLKSGNAVLLKGGSEAANTNKILAEIVSSASIKAGIPDNWLTLLETRADVKEMLDLDDYIDLIIPRGSNTFVKQIMQSTTIPVLGHADGICHVYIDDKADLDMAVNIVVDSKTQYVAVCNAVETVLVHKDIAHTLLPQLKDALEQKGVELRGCDKTVQIIKVKAAAEEDWSTEYLDLILSIKVVNDLNAAIDHINRYGSKHTDVIVTKNRANAIDFMDRVDSADVFLNCSSRFSDGFRFGLGAEVGISTNKIHARGPVGLEGLVIYKWILIGNGHIVADYSGKEAKNFIHKKLRKTFDLYKMRKKPV